MAVKGKRIVFTGGGTVGHVTLNLLLIPKFIQDGWEVHYIGDRKGVEYEQIQASELAVTFHGIATGKLRRYFSWQNLMDVFKVFWGIVQSFFILLRLRPRALFSKGGFVSVPPVIAARLNRVPVFIHESDLSMGLANKIAYRFATLLYTTFEQEAGLTKAKHVGAVTKVGEAEEFDRAKLAPIRAQFDPAQPTLLFIGGSAGAKVFNDFISQNPGLTSSYNIINITGDASLDSLSTNLYRVAYVSDLYQPLMNLADLVVTRGGSNTLFELLAMAKPHLIVPLGKAASRGDQLENAAYFEAKGYAKQLAEEDLNLAKFQQAVEEVLDQQDTYKTAMLASQEIQSLDGFYEILNQDMSQ